MTGKAKLTPADVQAIVKRYAAGETQSSLSRAYRISIGQIGNICRGSSWQGVTGGISAENEQQIKTAAAESAQRLMALLEMEQAPAAAIDPDDCPAVDYASLVQPKAE